MDYTTELLNLLTLPIQQEVEEIKRAIYITLAILISLWIIRTIIFNDIAKQLQKIKEIMEEKELTEQLKTRERIMFEEKELPTQSKEK